MDRCTIAPILVQLLRYKMNKQECLACDLPTNNHLVLFANLLRFIMSKGGVLVSYLFNSPIFSFAHPDSFNLYKNNFCKNRGNKYSLYKNHFDTIYNSTRTYLIDLELFKVKKKNESRNRFNEVRYR